MTPAKGMTPAERLAMSRQAIAEHLKRKERRSEPQRREAAPEGTPAPNDAPQHRRSGWFGTVTHALKAWWHHHPAHLAVEVATPVLQGYARKKPVQLIAAAAGFGVLLAVTRPWRLISATGLAVALVKSSQLPNMLMSMLASHDFGDFGEYGTPPSNTQEAQDTASHPPPY